MHNIPFFQWCLLSAGNRDTVEQDKRIVLHLSIHTNPMLSELFSKSGAKPLFHLSECFLQLVRG